MSSPYTLWAVLSQLVPCSPVHVHSRHYRRIIVISFNYFYSCAFHYYWCVNFFKRCVTHQMHVLFASNNIQISFRVGNRQQKFNSLFTSRFTRLLFTYVPFATHVRYTLYFFLLIFIAQFVLSYLSLSVYTGRYAVGGNDNDERP